MRLSIIDLWLLIHFIISPKYVVILPIPNKATSVSEANGGAEQEVAGGELEELDFAGD